LLDADRQTGRQTDMYGITHRRKGCERIEWQKCSQAVRSDTDNTASEKFIK